MKRNRSEAIMKHFSSVRINKPKKSAVHYFCINQAFYLFHLSIIGPRFDTSKFSIKIFMVSTLNNAKAKYYFINYNTYYM